MRNFCGWNLEFVMTLIQSKNYLGAWKKSFNLLLSYTFSCMEGPFQNMNCWKGCFCCWTLKSPHQIIGLTIVVVGKL
jgi:hypothetical protein